jgi:putative membrane protein
MKIVNTPLTRFLIRWLVCALGLWIASAIVSKSITFGNDFGVILVAGFVLAVVNTILKPIIILFSLPAIVFSLGLFMVIINGLTVYIASKLYHPFHVTNFWAAVFAGLVIGLVNYLVTTILEDVRQ